MTQTPTIADYPALSKLKEYHEACLAYVKDMLPDNAEIEKLSVPYGRIDAEGIINEFTALLESNRRLRELLVWAVCVMEAEWGGGYADQLEIPDYWSDSSEDNCYNEEKAEISAVIDQALKPINKGE